MQIINKSKSPNVLKSYSVSKLDEVDAEKENFPIIRDFDVKITNKS